jgi:hypothetical protein
MDWLNGGCNHRLGKARKELAVHAKLVMSAIIAEPIIQAPIESV